MCSFSIGFSGEAEALVKRAQLAVGQAGGSFTGNDTSGQMVVKTPIGTVSASYTVSEQQINITILKKPFLLSCKRIENELRKAMG